MKLYFTLFFSFFSTFALSASYSLSEVATFLNKNNACKIAIGINDLSEFSIRHSKDPVVFGKKLNLGKEWIDYQLNVLGQPKITSVICIQDLVVGEGTINESQGCTLTYYDVENNSYGKILGSSLIKCDLGGFKDLEIKIKQLAFEYNTYLSSSEKQAPVSLFNMKLFSLIKPGYKNIENLFAPHLHYYQKTPQGNIDNWKKWINDISAKEEKFKQYEEEKKKEIEIEENKKSETKKRRLKTVEKLYE